MKAISLTICIFFLSATLFATGDATALFESANASYQKGDYNTAIQTYEQLLADGYESAALHYNLGNAYFRKNTLGKAVLHLEKAALHHPKDLDIQHNLRIAKSKVKDQFDTIPGFFVSRWWKNAQRMFSPLGWGIITLLTLWGGITGLILWFRGKNRKLRKRGFLYGLIFLLLSFLPLFLGLAAAKNLESSQRAVVMVSQTDLKGAADELSESVLQLYEGTSLTILDEIGEWKKVRLSNGEEGWIELKTIEMI